LKKLLFTDLDDTLFQSHHKATPDDDWIPLAYLRNGEPISYASPRQQAFLSFLLQEMTLIPVTARNFDAFSRVRIPFPAQAIIDYGGIILGADGAPEAEWLVASRTSAQGCADAMRACLDALERENAAIGGDAHIRLISDFDIPFYVVAKSASHDIALISALYRHCREAVASGELPDVTLHNNHNNLALIPRWLNKRNAVDHLRRRYEKTHGPTITFGMGDALVDLDFMSACDYRIIPADSQIAVHFKGESA
jgi:hypothetical protein